MRRACRWQERMALFMSRKATITQKEIINAAFKLTRKEGFEEITSRKLAAAAGCSTQPIFRVYENMSALKKDVFDKTAQYYEDYCLGFGSRNDIPFISIGITNIGFAQKYPNLFRFLFLSKKENDFATMYDVINTGKGFVTAEVKRAKELGQKNPDELFMKMWTFIFGCSCMAVTGDFDLDEEQTRVMLESAYEKLSK